MAVTLVDVAKRSGVSTATASRVLNNKMVMPIPPTTVERIKRAAKELEYRPNVMARALATGRTHTLGLYSREMTDPHFAQMMEAVEAKARELGYHLAVCGELEGLLEGRVDGFILLSFPYEELLSVCGGAPALFVWHAPHPLPNCVCWSDIEGAYRAGKHLLNLGHRRIAGLFGYGDALDPLPAKVDGFRRAMEEAGAAFYEFQEALSPDYVENGYRLTRRLLHETDGVTALFARNDFLAMGALRALHEEGRRVPHDISVISYGDTFLARAATPPLTSIRTPIAEAGALAVEALIRSMQAGESSFHGTMLSTSLTLRHSCVPFHERHDA